MLIDLLIDLLTHQLRNEFPKYDIRNYKHHFTPTITIAKIPYIIDVTIHCTPNEIKISLHGYNGLIMREIFLDYCDPQLIEKIINITSLILTDASPNRQLSLKEKKW